MSLVVAYSGKGRAVIGGDRRSISFFGETEALEEELYGGKIRTEEDLRKRSEELGSKIAINDGREKVWKRGDLLAGEVTEISLDRQRRRRVYAVPGGYLLVEIDGRKAVTTKRGTSTLIILGNRFTRDLAFQRLGSGRKPPDEASFKALFEEAGRATASVSPDFTILTTDRKKADPQAALLRALREDCEEEGWELCGLL